MYGKNMRSFKGNNILLPAGAGRLHPLQREAYAPAPGAAGRACTMPPAASMPLFGSAVTTAIKRIPPCT